MDSHEPIQVASQAIGNIFISLHHADANVAKALSQAIRDVFGDLLTTNYSTSKELEGGIQHGKEWVDPRAYSRDFECAAFKTRFQRESSDLSGAAETCRAAWENNADSYYLGDVLGQCLLQLAKVDEARDVYRRVAAILDRLAETNIWTRATSATAALVLGDQPKLISALGQISRLDPAPDDLKRIEDGLERVAKALGQPADDMPRWRDLLRGRT